MTKDEIWQMIKKDQTKIYGQSLFDVFVQTTDDLTPEHFMEIDTELKSKITSESVYKILNNADVKDKKKIAKELGRENINKLTEDHVYLILYSYLSDIKDLESHAGALAHMRLKSIVEILGQENIDKLSGSIIYQLLLGACFYNQNLDQESNARRAAGMSALPDSKENIPIESRANEKLEIIAKMLGQKNINKLESDDLSDGQVYKLLESSKNKEQMAKILGQENINKMSSYNVHDLLIRAKDKQKMADMLGQEKIEQIDYIHVYGLLKYSQDKNQMAAILGQNNMNKLIDSHIFNLLKSASDQQQMALILGKENTNKLSQEQILKLQMASMAAARRAEHISM